MPLLWHVFAGGNCRYVGIASPQFSTHTAVMKNITVLLMVLLTALLSLNAHTDDAEFSSIDNHQQLVSQTQHWVARERNLDPSQIDVRSTDRRLRIPHCREPFEFAFAFQSSQKTIKAQCPDTGWQVFLGITVHVQSEVLRYRHDLNAGHILSPGDVSLDIIDNPAAGTIADVADLRDTSLLVPVKSGDLVSRRQLAVMLEVFELKRDIPAGEIISRADISVIRQRESSLTDSQSFSLQLLDSGVAASNLNKGRILSRYDIKEKHRALVIQKGLARGQVITPENAVIADYYGKLPTDALSDYDSVEQMHTIRNLRAGAVLRLSDLTPSNVINKGDDVQLSISNGALEVTLTMTALNNARLEQRVILMNPESGEKIQAVATGPGRAQGL